MGEIRSLHERLAASARFRAPAAAQWLIPLHSASSPAEQRQAFRRPPPGVRKVVIGALGWGARGGGWVVKGVVRARSVWGGLLVLPHSAAQHTPAPLPLHLRPLPATNIAETSLTIEDVVFVVDSGERGWMGGW